MAKKATNRPGSGVKRPKPKPLPDVVREAADTIWAVLPPEAAVVVLVVAPAPDADDGWFFVDPEDRGNPLACVRLASMYAEGRLRTDHD